MTADNETEQVAFRTLLDDDLVPMKRWLEDPDVSPWYQAEESTETDALRREFGDMIAGTDATRGFIIQVDGRSVGFIQCLVIDDEPDYARQLQVDPGAVGIDLFIGDPAARNRGLGTAVIRGFLEQVVFGELGAEVAIIGPAPDNTRAIRAYEKVGFTWLKTVYVVDESPANTGDEYVMRLTREDFEADDS